MKITINLNKHQSETLLQTAESLGIDPDTLASALLTESLNQPQQDFQNAARHFLNKNQELYDRLS